MTKEIKTEESPATQIGTQKDLSERIAATVEKEPGEEVRSVWVYGDYYRCNWWVQDKTAGPVYLTTGKISRSKFLRATLTGEKLVIEDLSVKASS